MSRTRMHADEVETDVSLARRLLAGQFPQWAGRGDGFESVRVFRKSGFHRPVRSEFSSCDSYVALRAANRPSSHQVTVSPPI